MPTFAEKLKSHQIEWSRNNRVPSDYFESEDGRPWVFKQRFKKSNLYDPDWWYFIEGKEHRWARSLNSSQCFAVNLFAPLAVDSALINHLWTVLFSNREIPDDSSISVEFEYTPDNAPCWLGEKGQATQIDVAIILKSGINIIGQLLIEVKLTEVEFGSCRGAQTEANSKAVNPDPSRCLSMNNILKNPLKQCWLAEDEGRKYWDIMLNENSSFEFNNVSENEACPFRHGLYQIMRNRVLADAIFLNNEAIWADFAIFKHPLNQTINSLYEQVCGKNDVITGINQFLPHNPVISINPVEYVAQVREYGTKWVDWADYISNRYILNKNSIYV